MVRQIAEKFRSIESTSNAIRTLELYHRELSADTAKVISGQISDLMEKDVSGKICFPMADRCRCQVKVKRLPGGMHEFLFTDGIYGFAVILEMSRNLKNPEKIHIRTI